MPGVIKITYVRCSGMGFVDFVTVQYLSHIVGSFVETVLTCQEVVLDKVCMGYLQFFVRSERNFAIQLLASGEGLFESCEAPICWFCILINSSKDDMISNGKARFGMVKTQVNNTFLGDDTVRRIKICPYVTLASPCLEGSYAKAYNNNDSLCCTIRIFIVGSNLRCIQSGR